MRVCVCVSPCVLVCSDNVAFDRCWQFISFASFYRCFVVGFSIFPFFILLSSIRIIPSLSLTQSFTSTPPSTIVSDRLTWSITNCCVCLRAVCKEHAWWNDLCRSWLQRHHQSLAMRIRLAFGPGTSGNGFIFSPRELALLLHVCDSRVCGWLFQSCFAFGVFLSRALFPFP